MEAAMAKTSHRSLTERWVITGTLVLETPAHFGNGDADPLTDMPLLFDEVEGRPLLPGTSIAGSLRNFLRERELGYGKKDSGTTFASKLFGTAREDESETGAQSPLIVNDAIGKSEGMELRDGVAIDEKTRTAEDNKKFDMQLLAAGSTFPLRFELLVSEDDESKQLRNFLVTALHGLQNREITLGARKRRGFGQVTVKDWQVYKYDLAKKEGLLGWLGSEQGLREPKAQEGKDLPAMLEAQVLTQDQRKKARLTATFKLDGTLMIRSGFGASDTGPDMVHIHSKRPKAKDALPVLPGTSLAGALRKRALKIVRTVSGNTTGNSNPFVDALFGPYKVTAGEKDTKASRVYVRETEIEKSTSLVITRVKIDRFTGGAYESALFSEEPAIGTPETRLTLDLDLRDPKEAELGLMLLLLKDLWTGDLPIGGESGIGRGRLSGVEATLEAPQGTWVFKVNGDNVQVSPNADEPEKWVKAFNAEVQEG
jgi:CRISPR/Cas system CSM-associated protein Csm3 (group 7 of RAMP superfamily)